MSVEDTRAFPSAHMLSPEGGSMLYAGMTLRDYFAAKMMAALITRNGIDAPIGEFADAAFWAADALLAARKEK